MLNIGDRLKRNRIVVLLTVTFNSFSANNSGLLAAAVAYNLLFSLFPFALAIISIAGFAMESPRFEERVIAALGSLIPVAKGMIANVLRGVIDARAATGVVAILGLIWTASAFFDALRKSLNAAWGIPNATSFVKGKLIAIGMTICAFIVLIVYIWLSTAVRFIQVAHLDSELFQSISDGGVATFVYPTLSAMLAFLLILLLYRFVPAKRPAWRDIWPEALMAAAGFEIVRFALIWYLRNFAEYNLVYGSVGAIIALLLFIYLSAWVLLFFAEVSAARLRLKTGNAIAGL
jgi:membrane protein